MRKGFTFIEIILAVIVVLVLLALSIPQYIKAVERSKIAVAKSYLDVIKKAENIHISRFGTYVSVPQEEGAWSVSALTDEVSELANLDEEAITIDWKFNVELSTSPAGDPGYKAIATRQRGLNKDKTIYLDQDNVLGGELDVY